MRKRTERSGRGKAVGWAALSLCVAGAVATATAADEAPAPTAEEVEACVRSNLPSRSSIQTIVFRVNGRSGNTTDSVVKIFWQKGEDELSKVLLRFDSPDDMRGSSLLLVEKPGRNDMFMYLPEMKRVRRVTGPSLSGGMFGTDFTYSQFERLQGVSRDLRVELLETGAELEGHRVHVLGHTPADDPEFEYVRSYVDSVRCVPLRTEFFESDRRLRKVLTAEEPQITQVGENWIPHRLVMQDVVQGTSTEFNIEAIEVNAKIHRKMFTQANLSRGR